MKLFQQAGMAFLERADDVEALHAIVGGGNLRLLDGVFEYTNYGKSVEERRFFVYENETYYCVLRGADECNYASFKAGDAFLVDSKGNKLDKTPELLTLIYSYSNYKYRECRINGAKIVGTLLDYPVDGGSVSNVFAIVDRITGECKVNPSVWSQKVCLLDDRVILFDRFAKTLHCFDFDLFKLWSFKPKCNLPKYFYGPVLCGDVSVQSFGPDRVTKSNGDIVDGVQHPNKVHHHDTILYGVDVRTGRELWQVLFSKSVDTVEFVNERLYIASASDIFILNPQNGEIYETINTGLSDDYDASIAHVNLHVEGGCLYYCHDADSCILVYTIADMKLERRIDIPYPYSVKGFEYYHKAKDKLYFELKPRLGRLYAHMAPLLEVDPSDLQSEIEFYDGPPVDITLRPSGDNRDEVELWVELHEVPLQEALVYAEMHTENQAFYHGQLSSTFVNEYVTENFNGKVHLRYSGSERPADEVRDLLAVLEKRFTQWAGNRIFAGNDPSKPVTLETHYIE